MKKIVKTVAMCTFAALAMTLASCGDGDEGIIVGGGGNGGNGGGNNNEQEQPGNGGGNENDDDDLLDEYTTITGNLSLTLAAAYADYYGNLRNGASYWYVEFYSSDYSQVVFADIFNTSSTDPAGEYTVDDDWTMTAGTAMSGDYAYDEDEDDFYIMGLWYVNIDDDMYITAPYAAARSGNMSIKKSSGTNYNVSIEFLDDRGHKVTATYSGKITISDESQSSLSLHKATNQRVNKAAIPGFTSLKRIAKR